MGVRTFWRIAGNPAADPLPHRLDDERRGEVRARGRGRAASYSSLVRSSRSWFAIGCPSQGGLPSGPTCSHSQPCDLAQRCETAAPEPVLCSARNPDTKSCVLMGKLFDESGEGLTPDGFRL